MDIRIRSIDTHGQDYEKKFEVFRTVELKDRKEYHYNDENGRSRIVRGNGCVEIFRQGSVNSRQVFRLHERTAFIYIAEGFRGEYEIFTKKLDINNGKIFIEYDIIYGNEIINSIGLEISHFKE